MKLTNAALLTTVLAASASASRLSERSAGTFGPDARGGVVRRKAKGLSNSPEIAIDEDSSQNWAGIYTTYAGVSGASAVLFPPHKFKGGKAGVEYAGSMWVGVDGMANCTGGTGAFISAGINWTRKDGKTTYAPFYQWYPGGQKTFPNFTLNTASLNGGFEVSAQATSATSATFTIANGETADMTTVTLEHQPRLCRNSAEMMISDPLLNGELAPFTTNWHAGGFFSGGFFDNGPGSTSGYPEIEMTPYGLTCNNAYEDSGIQVVFN